MHGVAVNSFPQSHGLLANNYLPRVLAALSLVVLVGWLGRAWLRPMTFDDAYMFYRYALNIRHGLGIAWNPDGVPTYGMTGLLWAFFVLPWTAVPLSLGHALELASWLTGVAALGTLALAVARHAHEPLRGYAVAFAAVALPLVLNPVFAFHLTTGMDTMLSLWANAAVALLVMEYVAAPTFGKSVLIGVAAFAAVLARPDSGMCVMGVPALTWLIIPGRRRWWDLAGLCALPTLLIGTELLLCAQYFQAPLPLSFYAKSLRGYVGFTSHENAVQYAYMAGTCALPFAAVLAATFKRDKLPLLVAFLLPAALTMLYLVSSVRQVMGFGGRYYIPLLPFLVVPALVNANVELRRLAAACAVLVALYGVLRPIELGLEKTYSARVVPAAIAVPVLPVAARTPLQQYEHWYPTVPVVGDLIAALPPGAVVAASEVGYIAAAAPKATIIDLVGLNDTRIGLHGFSMEELLARKPDLIWFPHSDYTGLRATMLSDPKLYTNYVVVADMFNFGIAIRRDSPMHDAVESGVRKAWSKLYPSARLADYTVPNDYLASLNTPASD
jgi:hypothetical protein